MKATMSLALVAVGLLSLLTRPALAEDAGVVGRWVYKADGIRVEMQFTADGQCTATATKGEKSSIVTGSYRASATELTVTPKGGKAITYGLKLNDDALELSGGDFGEGNSLVLARRVTPTAHAPDKAAHAPADPEPKPAAETPKPAAAEKPAAEKPAPEPAAEELPGGTWNIKAIEKDFDIVKTKYDSSHNKVTWVLERKEDAFASYDAAFYDEDDVKLATVFIAFMPTINNTAKGERTRATIELPAEAMLKTSRKVVVTRRGG